MIELIQFYTSKLEITLNLGFYGEIIVLYNYT